MRPRRSLLLAFVALAGTLPAAAQIAVSDYDFGETWVRNACSKNAAVSVLNTLRITNHGSEPVVVTGLRMAGPDTAAVRIDRTGSSDEMISVGDTIAPGATRRQKVAFSPSEEQPYLAMLRVETSGGTAEGRVTGVGMEAHVSVTDVDADTVTIRPGTRPTFHYTVRAVSDSGAPSTLGLWIWDLEVTGSTDVYASLYTSIHLKAGDSIRLPIEIRATKPGPIRATVRLLGNHSRCDDDRFEVRAVAVEPTTRATSEERPPKRLDLR